MTDTTERADMKLAYAVRNAALNTLRECDVSEELLAAVGVATYASIRATPQPMGEDVVERVARAICEEIGFDPDYLEPGDDPYQERAGMPSRCIDGYNSKDEPCHFFWRHYHLRARAALAAMPQPTSTVEAGDALREAREALTKCRDKFHHYTDLHLLKCTSEGDEKADRNREMADLCDAALAKLDTAEKGCGE